MMEPISEIFPLDGNTPDDLFVTCASFEQERSWASVHRFSAKFQTKCAVLINFLSNTNPEGERKKRESAEKLLIELERIDVFGIPRLITIPPYNYFAAIHALMEELHRRNISSNRLSATVDISCLTKIQLIFLLKLLIEETPARKLRLLYSLPRHYNTKKGDKFSRLSVGYFDPIPVPLRSTIGVSSICSRVALVILGHEGQRTLSAFRRADPDETVLILPTSSDPNLMNVCRKENKFLLTNALTGDPTFHLLECHHMEVHNTKKSIVHLLANFSRERDLHVSIIPFGPKPLVVGAILATLLLRNISFDVVYPTPTSYNSDYSSGVKDVFSIQLLPIQEDDPIA